MSLVYGNDGFSNIFGKPKPAPGGAIGAAVDKFVSSPVFPIIATALVAGPVAADYGAIGSTALKVGAIGVGALSASNMAKAAPTIKMPNVTIPKNEHGISMDTTTTQANTTATNPQVPAAAPNVVIVPSAQANAGLMWAGLAAIFFLLYKGKR